MKLLYETAPKKTKISHPPYLREMIKDNLSFFLTRFLSKEDRVNYVILAHIKHDKKRYFPFLLLICHRSFENKLRRKFDMDLMLDIEAKRVGVWR